MKIREEYKTTSIIITHDMGCAKITADRVLIMDDGQYVAEGTYDELAKSENEFVRSFLNNKL